MSTNVGTLRSTLTLDMSGFTKGIGRAVSAAQRLGTSLSTALGSSSQGFSAISSSANNAAGSINNVSQSLSNLNTQASGATSAVASMVGQVSASNPFTSIDMTVQSILHEMQAMQATIYDINTALTNTNTILQRFMTVLAGNSNLTNTANQASRINQNLGQASRNAQNVSNNLNGAGRGAQNANNATRGIFNNLNKAAFRAKDIKRILEGIVVSQVFYRLLGVMTDLVSASYEFMCNMEQTQLSFKYLLGDAEAATGLVQMLQDFAIASPLDTSGAADATRYLLNMGFAARNVVDVLSVITDAAVVSGQNVNDTVYSISRALGQMLQSGTASAQEIRQLYNAGVPVTKILNKQLGLTGEQVKNIGDYAIDSGTVVTAILKGMQDQFSGASQEMQTTVAGAMSAIKDSIYVFSNVVFSGVFDAWRQKLVNISNAMQQLVQIARRFGPGGVFEALIPSAQWQAILRNVIGALQQLGVTLQFIGKIVGTVFKAASQEVLQILNILLPPIAILTNFLVKFVYGLLQACPAIKYFAAALTLIAIARPIMAILLWFWKIVGLGGICAKVAGYVATLVKTIWTLATINPVVTAIAVVIGIILTLTGVTQKCINKIRELVSMLGGKLSKYTRSDKTFNKDLNIGYNPNDILQPVDKDTSKATQDYQNIVDGLAGSLDKTAKNADKTKKALKNSFNQSFDEVFGINPKESSANDILGFDPAALDLTPLEELTANLGELSDFQFDFGGSLDNFMSAWYDMIDAILKWAREHVGALALGLAAILTGLALGNPWIALAGLLGALFWETLCEKLGEDPNAPSNIGTAIGALIGGAIGGILGGPMGAAIGMAIGTLVGRVVGLLVEGFKTGNFDYSGIGAGLGALIGAGIGFIFGGPAGAAIGAAIGTITGKVVGLLVDGFKNGNWDVKGISTGLGTLIGAGIGFVIGGPAGAVIGAAIGALVGWIASKFITADWGAVKDAFCQPFMKLGDSLSALWSNIWTPIKEAFESGDWISIGLNIVAGIITGIVGAIVSIAGAVVTFFKALWAAFCEIFGIHSPATTMYPIGEYIIKGILEGILSVLADIVTWVDTNIYQPFNKAVSDCLKTSNFLTFGSNIINGIFTGISSVIMGITAWINTNVYTPFNNALLNYFTINNFKTAGTNVLTSIKSGISSAISSISSWISINVWSPFKNAVNSYFTTSALASAGSNIMQGLLNGMKSAMSNIKSWLRSNVYDQIVDGIKSLFDIHSPAKKMVPLGEFVSKGFGLGITGAMGDVIKNINADMRDVLEAFNIGENPLVTWSNDVWASVNTQITRAIEKIKELMDLANTGLLMNASMNGLNVSREQLAGYGNRGGSHSFSEEAFADAMAARLGPMMSNMRNGGNGSDDNRRPLYVGTLIADERGLRELDRKMRRITDTENERRGN